MRGGSVLVIISRHSFRERLQCLVGLDLFLSFHVTNMCALVPKTEYPSTSHTWSPLGVPMQFQVSATDAPSVGGSFEALEIAALVADFIGDFLFDAIVDGYTASAATGGTV